MANFTSPNGLTPIGSETKTHTYTASAAIARGDLLALVSGKVLPYATASHSQAIGVAMSPADADGDTVIVCDAPNALFRIESSGSNYVAATHDGNRYDVTGLTGVMTVDLSAQTQGILVVQGHSPIPGATGTGQYARVAVRIAQHALAAMPSSDPGTATFDTVKAAVEVQADTISEKTAAAGVTIDGVKCKDSQVYTDTINEKTAAAGVTLDSVLLKDGSVSTADAGSVSTNTISEKTAGSGVTADSVLLKDGGVSGAGTIDMAGTIEGSAFVAGTALTGDTVKPRLAFVEAAPAGAAGYGKGSIIFDVSDGKLKVNTGDDATPTWTVVGTQA